jgi:hypothetical protein
VDQAKSCGSRAPANPLRKAARPLPRREDRVSSSREQILTVLAQRHQDSRSAAPATSRAQRGRSHKRPHNPGGVLPAAPAVWYASQERRANRRGKPLYLPGGTRRLGRPRGESAVVPNPIPGEEYCTEQARDRGKHRGHDQDVLFPHHTSETVEGAQVTSAKQAASVPKPSSEARGRDLCRLLGEPLSVCLHS